MDEVCTPGRVAVITGGASGIGLAVALKCASDHQMRVVLADVDESALASAHTEVEAAGAAAVMSVVCDVTKVQDYEALADGVFGEFGDVAFLFLNAGLTAGFSAYSTPLEQWKLCLDVNVWGVINGLHVFTPRMIAQGAGRPSKIVATSSLSGLMNSAPDTGVPYVVAKHSCTLIMESLQHELRRSEAKRHVSAHLLHPGIVRTNITENSMAAARNVADVAPRAIGQTDEQLRGMTDEESALYKEATLSGRQLADGLWAAMAADQFYCIVSPPSQPPDLYKGLVGLRAEDVMLGLPPLSQHVPELRAQSRGRLKAMRAKSRI